MNACFERGKTLKSSKRAISLILAAGRGSRMKDYCGSKTLLPLAPGTSPYTGSHPILPEILNNLPHGPKALVVNHMKKDVIKATQDFELSYCEQPVLNGTGGALMAARGFLEKQVEDTVIITMGDVPLVKPSTFIHLIDNLKGPHLNVLGFRPFDKKKYGVLEIDGDRVRKITEWEYWNQYPREKQNALSICNSGIYAARRQDLLHYTDILASRPHIIRKERNGKMVDVEEFFITDVVEYMCNDGIPVGYVIGDEDEVMGVDDLPALKKAQTLYLKSTQKNRATADAL